MDSLAHALATGSLARSALALQTVVTVAHRLRTVVFYHRVLVMDAGRKLEYDTPSALLRNSSSRFRAMCAATGDLTRLESEAEAAEAEAGALG